MSWDPVPFKNPLALAAASLLLLASDFLPASWVSESVRYFALGYLGLGLLLHAFKGYRRRRPFWSADSWRRYLIALAIPIVSLGMLFTMVALAGSGHPMAGASRSAARIIWTAVSIAFMLVGAGGIVFVIHWLHAGDPSEPFSLSASLRGRRRPAAGCD